MYEVYLTVDEDHWQAVVLHGNEISASIKIRNFLLSEQLLVYQGVLWPMKVVSKLARWLVSFRNLVNYGIYITRYIHVITGKQ
jgi:hypothetical protein